MSDLDQDVSELAAGTELGGYRIEGRLGAGGMSVIYEATDVALDRRIALKVMAPRLSLDEAFRDRFLREARATSAIEHPNVVPIYATGELDGRLYIAMRLIPGAFDLRKRLQEAGRLEVDEAVGLLAQAAAALDACHAHGLVHRDVKPDNLLLSPDEVSPGIRHVHLTDFGLTRAPSEQRLTKAGQILGTLAYAAPEQLRSEEVDARIDVYALGVTMFECLAGQRPFVRDNQAALMYAQVNDAPPRLHELRPDMPGAVDDVVDRAMAKHRAERYASCGELIVALRDASGATLPRGLEPRITGDRTHLITDGTDRALPEGLTEPNPDQVPGRNLDDTDQALDDPRDGANAVHERRRKAWPLRVGLGVLLVSLLAGTLFTVSRRASQDGAFRLPRLTSANGLTVDRAWRLVGASGDRFEASTEIANPSDRPVSYTHDEVFPKSLAADADLITADPAPDRVVFKDPVLRWRREVAPKSKLVLRFTIAVPPGDTSNERLRAWAVDRRREESSYAKTPEARESDTPFEVDEPVEVAATVADTGAGTTGTVAEAPTESVESSTSSSSSSSSVSSTTASTRLSTTTTRPPSTITTTTLPPGATTTTSSRTPGTIDNTKQTSSYVPGGTPPSSDEATIIDNANSVRTSFGRAALTRDGNLINAARARSQANANARTLNAAPLGQITPYQLNVEEEVRRGSSLQDAWNDLNSTNFRGVVSSGDWQYIGAGVARGSDGLYYVTVAFLRVR